MRTVLWRRAPAPPRVAHMPPLLILGEPGGNVHLPTAPDLSSYQKMGGLVSREPSTSARGLRGPGTADFPKISCSMTILRGMLLALEQSQKGLGGEGVAIRKCG